MSIRVGTVVAIVMSVVACGKGAPAKKKPARQPLSATAKWIQKDGKDLIEFDVTGDGDTEVTINVLHAEDGTQPAFTTTDVDGHGTILAQPWTTGPETQQIYLESIGEEVKNTTVEVTRSRAITLTGDGFACTGDACHGKVDHGAIVIGGLKKGTKVTAGGVDYEAPDDGAETTIVPKLDGELATAKLAELYDSKQIGATSTVTVPVSVTPPDGGAYQGALPLTNGEAREALETRLKTVNKGPVTFAGEAAPAAGAARSIWFDNGFSSLIGPAATPAEIDLVGLLTFKSHKVDCGEYAGGGQRTHLKLDVNDYTVAVYERRTGKKVASTFLKGKADCASSISESGGATTNQGGYGVGTEEIVAWLGQQFPDVK
jgi:hypothetical protein